MPDHPFNLAIETSGRAGSLCLGHGDAILGEAQIPPQANGGASSDLMTHLDALCRAHDVKPAQLGEVYLSIGPGSFTGLRIGVTVTKMLAQVLGVKVIAVPTLNVLAQNAPTDLKHVATCLNMKKETVYSGVFERCCDRWLPRDQPQLRTMRELLAAAPRPIAILGDPLPALPADLCDQVAILPAALATARAAAVWKLGRESALAGEYIDPWQLIPIYARPPEAIELWDKIHGPAKAIS